MIERMLALDGVLVICQFRDDGNFVDGYGLMEQRQMMGLVSFAHGYKRIVQGNTDQLSMFTQMKGWTPPTGWVVHGHSRTVCSVGNLVCLIENADASLNEVMQELKEIASW